MGNDLYITSHIHEQMLGLYPEWRNNLHQQCLDIQHTLGDGDAPPPFPERPLSSGEGSDGSGDNGLGTRSEGDEAVGYPTRVRSLVIYLLSDEASKQMHCIIFQCLYGKRGLVVFVVKQSFVKGEERGFKMSIGVWESHPVQISVMGEEIGMEVKVGGEGRVRNGVKR